MSVAIILPCYLIDAENLAHYRKFIETLEANTPRQMYDLIIVDNGSNLGREEMQRDADIYFEHPEPMGYAKAVNAGMAAAKSLCVVPGRDLTCVVVNNDIELPQHWLEDMLEIFKETGGLLAPQDFPAHKDRIYYDQSWYSLWMIKMSTWEKVGTLDDEKLNYRFHDQDYSIRLKKAGLFIGRTGKVQVKHINSATYSKMKRNEDPEEREEMMRRYGFALFSDWMRAGMP